ncbi:MAG: hypothetical protein MJ211_13805 [Bacteroidales bacterium]|nr:hypothetical protein [Bacteroidales bacterium]
MELALQKYDFSEVDNIVDSFELLSDYIIENFNKGDYRFDYRNKEIKLYKGEYTISITGSNEYSIASKKQNDIFSYKKSHQILMKINDIHVKKEKDKRISRISLFSSLGIILFFIGKYNNIDILQIIGIISALFFGILYLINIIKKYKQEKKGI